MQTTSEQQAIMQLTMPSSESFPNSAATVQTVSDRYAGIMTTHLVQHHEMQRGQQGCASQQ